MGVPTCRPMSTVVTGARTRARARSEAVGQAELYQAGLYQAGLNSRLDPEGYNPGI